MNEKKTIRLDHCNVMPNHLALVKRFCMGDNFYCDSDHSADGHRWLMGIQPTPYFSTAWTSGYGGRRKQSATASQPGRRRHLDTSANEPSVAIERRPDHFHVFRRSDRWVCNTHQCNVGRLYARRPRLHAGVVPAQDDGWRSHLVRCEPKRLDRVWREWCTST